jgi:hypothetical protein
MSISHRAAERNPDLPPIAEQTAMTPARSHGPWSPTISHDAPDGLFRPCGCGGIFFTVAPGVGPQLGHLSAPHVTAVDDGLRADIPKESKND